MGTKPEPTCFVQAQEAEEMLRRLEQDLTTKDTKDRAGAIRLVKELIKAFRHLEVPEGVPLTIETGPKEDEDRKNWEVRITAGDPVVGGKVFIPGPSFGSFDNNRRAFENVFKAFFLEFGCPHFDFHRLKKPKRLRAQLIRQQTGPRLPPALARLPVIPASTGGTTSASSFWQQRLAHGHAQLRTPDGLRKAIQMCDAALAGDPACFHAQALRFLCLAAMHESGYEIPKPHSFRRSLRDLERAQTIPEAAEPLFHFALAVAAVHGNRDFREAANRFHAGEVVGENRCFAGRQFKAEFLLAQGLHDEAIRVVQADLNGEPDSSPLHYAKVVRILSWSSRTADAIKWLDEATVLDKNGAALDLARAHHCAEQARTELALLAQEDPPSVPTKPQLDRVKGHIVGGLAALDQAFSRQRGEYEEDPDGTRQPTVLWLTERACLLAAGRGIDPAWDAEARSCYDKVLERRERYKEFPLYFLAVLHCQFGHLGKAMDVLEAAERHDCPRVLFFRVDPRLAPLRAASAYQERLRDLDRLIFANALPECCFRPQPVSVPV
jgi:tetratricopeptide (TPR) repeat protein